MVLGAASGKVTGLLAGALSRESSETSPPASDEISDEVPDWRGRLSGRFLVLSQAGVERSKLPPINFNINTGPAQAQIDRVYELGEQETRRPSISTAAPCRRGRPWRI
jgi:hypothetical protein